MRLIIAGPRTFDDYPTLAKRADLIHRNHGVTEVVCGLARGADTLGKRWAEENGIPVAEFPAQWDKYGRAAGPVRNREMGLYADAALVFWNGKSRGSKNMIDHAKRLRLRLWEVRYDD